jgi:hypothetical protein
MAQKDQGNGFVLRGLHQIGAVIELELPSYNKGIRGDWAVGHAALGAAIGGFARHAAI